MQCPCGFVEGAYLCIMNMKQASLTDYESVLSFYDDVMERSPEIER